MSYIPLADRMTRLSRLIYIAACIIVVQAAHASAASSKPGPTGDSLVMAKLSNTRTYDRVSSDDLLTASVGADASVCTVTGTNISPSHCADLAKQEILRRRPVKELLTAVREGNGADGKAFQAIQLLEKIRGPEVEAGLRHIAEPYDGNVGNYLALQYFADRCETWSLKILNDHWFDFGIPSFVWGQAVEDFGYCHYLPATANMISSLDAASGNLSDAANDALRRMYPDGPKGTVGDAAVKAWTAYVSAHSSH